MIVLTQSNIFILFNNIDVLFTFVPRWRNLDLPKTFKLIDPPLANLINILRS